MKKLRKIATAIILNNNKILLVKRKYDPYKNYWCAPGGYSDKENKESIEDCAIRETKEETDIDIELIKKIKILEIFNKDKDRVEEIHVFLAKPLSLIVRADSEVLDAKWFSFKELNQISIIPSFKKILSEIINS